MSYNIFKNLRVGWMVFLCSILSFSPVFGQTANYPVADPHSVVKMGNVRFTVLTPDLIRMEWDSLQNFNDAASFVVINRQLPVPTFSKSVKRGWLSIKTSSLELSYKLNSGKFNRENLKIKYLNKTDAFTWVPGTKQMNNLKGTYRTLDGFNGDTHRTRKTKVPLEDGLLSTDGWTLIDDSQSLIFDNSDWPWVNKRVNNNAQDWYFMAYGKNYTAALKEFTLIAGKIPLPPRYAFGYWWSRYWSYSDNELRNLVGNFKKYDIPLDVLVIDMDWHNTDSLTSRHDEFGQKQQWTGWTWNKRLFSDPDDFLTWVKGNHLKTTLNLHPASGIAPYEEPYKRFAEKMNFDTLTHKNIPYEPTSKKFMTNLFDVVLHPMEKKGISFWWLDWQQWLNDKKIPELSNTWWLNYTFFTDQERNSDTRPLLYHRWGGLGNHRYQIGFSGDVVVSWASLNFQPYFTNCASNVLYGYWSHDIGGHMLTKDMKQELNPELYVRWMQYGGFSPIFRTHTSKSAVLNKEIWNFRGEYFDALYNSIHLRYQLSPYIYTMAREAYDTGISLCRPMYYSYSREPLAYTYKNQYFFGDDMLVCPITSAMQGGKSDLKLWLPKGNDWYEWCSGTLLKGGQEVNRSFSLDEYPVYVKAGSVIPMYNSSVKNLDENPQNIIIGVFPGGDGTANIYEDNGTNKDYATHFAITRVVSKVNSINRTQEITIYPREGQYQNMTLSRTYTIRLYGAEIPQEIKVNDRKLDFSLTVDSDKWNYDGNELAVNIFLPRDLCSTKQEIKISYSKKDSVNVNTGIKRVFKELTKLVLAKKFEDPAWIVPDYIGNCEETNLKLGYYPEQFYSLIQYFNSNFSKSLDDLNGMKKK
ncbi:MAG: glycoside hydrolase family 31 protein [Bacteroidota bacterium]|nr:glycoside hydrolase family 31 protein [Bacteroidota bacterium]